MALKHSKIPHQNTKVLVDLKEHKASLDKQAEEQGILPTTLARLYLLEQIKKGGKK